MAQSISTTIDRREILIGEPILYKIKMTVPAPTDKVQFILPDSIDHFEILNRRVVDTTAKRENYSELTLKLTSWDSGKWYIPAIPLQITRGGGNAFLKTEPIEINVGHMPIDSTGTPRDIKSVLKVPFTSFNYWLLLPLLILAIQLYIILPGLLKKKQQVEKPVFDSNLQPLEEAIDALKKLEPDALRTPAEIKSYHVNLTDIFRRYYSRIRRRNYLTNTTDEILMDIKAFKAGDGAISHISEVLRRSDAVKFAKYLPTREDNKASRDKLADALTQLDKETNKN